MITATSARTTPEELIALFITNKVKIVEIHPSQGYIKVTKAFTPGSNSEYIDAEADCGDITRIPRVEPGSDWGTDSGSIGGAIGLRDGRMVLHSSGRSPKFLAKLQKLATAEVWA